MTHAPRPRAGLLGRAVVQAYTRAGVIVHQQPARPHGMRGGRQRTAPCLRSQRPRTLTPRTFSGKSAVFPRSSPDLIRFAGFRPRDGGAPRNPAYGRRNMSGGSLERTGGMMIRQASAWMLALLIGVASASAQQGTTEVRGRVVDAQGGMLPGVTLTVKNQDTGMFRTTVSGEDGTFIVSGIVPGRYEVSAELQGFKKFLRRNVELELGRTTSVDVPLEVGALSEVVNVSAESPLVDVTSKEVGGNITTRELVELPSINGNFVGFVGLLPGIVPTISNESFSSDSITVNGQDPRNNNYMLDGGNNNDDVIGQRAGTQARTPIEAIQEFQVITGQYDAQYGRTSGAVVNAVTKSGTNTFKGVAFAFGQNGSLTTKDFFTKEKGNAKPDTQYQRWGGTA